MDVSFSCVCPVIDNEFRHCQSSLRMHWAIIASCIHGYFDKLMTKFMINNRTDV